MKSFCCSNACQLMPGELDWFHKNKIHVEDFDSMFHFLKRRGSTNQQSMWTAVTILLSPDRQQQFVQPSLWPPLLPSGISVISISLLLSLERSNWSPPSLLFHHHLAGLEDDPVWHPSVGSSLAPLVVHIRRRWGGACHTLKDYSY